MYQWKLEPYFHEQVNADGSYGVGGGVGVQGGANLCEPSRANKS
jgi:hypothetical protein